MIEIEELSKVYGRRARAIPALRDVSLSLDPGVWGVVGPNGAGKTTLLALILGFLRPSGGSVTIDGLDPRPYLRRHGAAYLPERFTLPPAWPVRSALLALSRLEGHGGAEAAGRVDLVLDSMGLADQAHRPVGDLSRGRGQRVGLAQTLLGDRRLVVLDEPTEGLDPIWRVRFRDLVIQLRDEDRTVLLASHDLSEIERLADHVIVLDDGRVTGVMDVRQPPGGPLRFRLVVDAAVLGAPALDAPVEQVRAAFPGAETAAVAGDSEGMAFLVVVADTAELSHRLAALLEAGAVVRAVTPLSDDLEARVRQRLEER